MKQLDPKAIWLFYSNFILRALFTFVPFLFFFTFAVGFTAFEELGKEIQIFSLFYFIIKNWWISLLLLLAIGYMWARFSWHFYKYELTKDGFRKESGIIWKKYVTIPYERIQNVDIYRGVIARLLGLSDLQIQTAGMSASVGRYGVAGAGSEGRLPGVSREIAEKLRDELVKKARGKGGI